MSEASSTTVVTCPACGASGSGRYCADCATPLRGASCAMCGTALVAGARYCHGCGASTSKVVVASPVATRPTAPDAGSARSRMLSWGVAVVAFVALAALVLARRPDGSDAAASAAPLAAQMPLAGGTASAGPPDISSMTPRERAERLYDRTMMAKEAGKLDSAKFFAKMAVVAYGDLADPSLDDRYDLGRVALVAGAVPRARAEADAILASRPTHLLGLLLAEDAARANGDETAAKAAHARLIAAAPTERQVGLPEYASHATELGAALDGTGGTGAPVRR